MASDHDNLEAIRVRIDGLADKIEAGFTNLHHAIVEQNSISESIAARLHTVEMGEAGCRAVREEFRETVTQVSRLREEAAAAKARIGFVVAGASIAASAAVAAAMKYLGG